MTETLEPGWANTDPGVGPPYVKQVIVSSGLDGAGQTRVDFGNTPCVGEIEIKKIDEKTGGPLGGACFNITPNLYNLTATEPLTVCNNSTNDSNNTAGVILLANVTCGNYSVTEDSAPEGYLLDPNPQSKTVSNGEMATFVSTNTKECSSCLEICKYEDKNGNHTKDYGESYLSGWNFTVSDSDGNSWNVTTGGERCGDCDYCVSVCELTPGNYTITETLKDGWTCTTGNSRRVTVVCDETETVEFGNQQGCSGCLKIYKYEDRDGDGQKDYVEPYLSSWEFTITDSGGNSQSGTTNWYGYATICSLSSGNYTVTETFKDGWTNTDPRDGSLSKTVKVSCGTTTTVKFGNQRECHGYLKIWKYEDKNVNGMRDYREPYLSGWEFTITDSKGNSRSVTTNQDGYVTCDLRPGNYTITEVLKDGWRNTDPGGDSPSETKEVKCGCTTTVKFGNHKE